ncbi:MAG TPA: YbdK family carboxylate-amine ligase [Solirubrobacterales bacterium]|nr:YbdK family carboxylate-amine ligase [Solirubrobacterales bacterium]
MSEDSGLDLDKAVELFEASQDFTVGLEEEFAILDPDSLELAHEFEAMKAACDEDELLAVAAAGELIDTEIEIRSGKGEDFADAASMQREHRERLFAVADRMGLGLGSWGTHPWANYLDQQIIDTEHYNRLRGELQWVALRNNTWSNHVHVGIRGADRAIAVCDHLREVLPPLLALSANSPFLDGHGTGLHSTRTQIFTRMFPRCGVHEPFGSWENYASFIEKLKAAGAIVEATQLWWSVRPHHRFGTVELRICDAQTDGAESFALASLIGACIGQAALDYDEGVLPEPLAGREIEENLWRAIRWGLDGEMIDWRGGGGLVETRREVERLAEWSAPAAQAMKAGVDLPERNGACRSTDALDDGAVIGDIYRDAVEETRRTYAPELSSAG